MPPPWWEGTLAADLRRMLDPGSDDLDLRPDVLIVGGGVVGLAAAVMCRRAGLGRVQVIERDRLACGPSGSAAGGLAPGMHAIARPPEFAALAAEGLALHRTMDEEWGGGLALRAIDWLIVSPERIASGSIDAPGRSILGADEARAIEPRLAEIGGAIHVPAQSWVQPMRLAAQLARRAGRVATGVSMTEMRTRAGRVVSIATTVGEISPGAVVLATGSAPPSLGVPQIAVKGHLLVTAPAPDPPTTAIASSIIVLPLEDGRLLAGGTFDRGDDEAVVRGPVVEQIRTEMSSILPSTRGIAVERAWWCFRPGTPDEMPVIDRLPGLKNAWMSVGHYRTGLLLAPSAGRVVADWVGGTMPSGMERFSLSRLV